MTDTVNKQALDLAKRWLKDIEGTKSATALLATVALSEIQAIEDQAPLGSTPPTTPVQGYREELEGIHRILVSGDDYTEAKDMRSVITSATWACGEALSQPDIQTGMKAIHDMLNNPNLAIACKVGIRDALVALGITAPDIGGWDFGTEAHPDIQPSGWIPIESAPKDGTDILVLNDDGHVYEANWNGYMWRLASASQHGCGCCGGDEESPTHWMPLPPGINSTEDQPGPSISTEEEETDA